MMESKSSTQRPNRTAIKITKAVWGWLRAESHPGRTKPKGILIQPIQSASEKKECFFKALEKEAAEQSGRDVF